MKIEYPLAKDTITKKELKELSKWLKDSPRLTKDKLTLEFEEKLAEYTGVKYSVFVNSGSSANLLMAYAAKLLNPNNLKVVVPSVGWATTIAPFMQFGFTPIMVGADEKTFGIDLKELEEICKKENPSTVIFVQVLGVPHYKEKLLSLSKKYNFLLLEDACAAQGSEYEDGTKVGAVGDMSTFSFYYGHSSSTIEGGSINTNRKDLYDLLVMLRSHGWAKDLDSETYDKMIKENGVDPFHKPFTFFIPGFNVRSTDLQAYIGLQQIKKYDKLFKQRFKNHKLYAKLLKGKFQFQKWGKNKPVSISFGILAESTEQRKKIVEALVKNGIETRIFSAGNLGKHPFWKNSYSEFSHPMSDRIHSCGLFLPNNVDLKRKDIEFICKVILDNA